MNRDLERAYRILGVDPGVSSAELQHAYHDLAQIWHPDRFAHSERLRRKAERNLKRITEAYRTLAEHEGWLAVAPGSVLRSTMSAAMGLGSAITTKESRGEAARGPAPPRMIRRRRVRVVGFGARHLPTRKASRRRTSARRRRAAVIALVVLVIVSAVAVWFSRSWIFGT